MKPSIQALAMRVLKAREDAARAQLAEAQRAVVQRQAESVALEARIAAEREAGAVLASSIAALNLAPWTAAAARQAETSRQMLAAAEAGCEGPQTALAEAVRQRLAVETFVEQQAKANRRAILRRDPLNALLSSGTLPDQEGELGQV